MTSAPTPSEHPSSGEVASPATVLLGIPFPAELAGFGFRAAADNEAQRPGAGGTLTYRRGAWRGTIHLYTENETGIPDDVKLAQPAGHFERVLLGIEQAGEDGLYSAVRLVARHILGGESGQPEFLLAIYELADTTGPQSGFVFLTTFRGRYVQARVMGRPTDDGLDVATGFALALGDWLKQC